MDYLAAMKREDAKPKAPQGAAARDVEAEAMTGPSQTGRRVDSAAVCVERGNNATLVLARYFLPPSPSAQCPVRVRSCGAFFCRTIA